MGPLGGSKGHGPWSYTIMSPRPLVGEVVLSQMAPVFVPRSIASVMSLLPLYTLISNINTLECIVAIYQAQTLCHVFAFPSSPGLCRRISTLPGFEVGGKAATWNQSKLIFGTFRPKSGHVTLRLYPHEAGLAQTLSLEAWCEIFASWHARSESTIPQLSILNEGQSNLTIGMCP